MIELIKEGHDRKFDDVLRLQQSKSPIIVYGAGSYAKDIGKFFKKHKISVSAYCVDDQWMHSGLMVDGVLVQPLEQYLNKHNNAVVVIGFADYKKATARLNEVLPGIEYVFIDAPNQFGFFNYEYIKEHVDEFDNTYMSLADQLSKDIFIAFINSKLSGDPTPLYGFAEFNQYFGDPMVLVDDEIMVDCGAYDGDTIKAFLRNNNGKYGKIFALEPNGQNFAKLKESLDKLQLENVNLINKGAWSKSTKLMFNDDSNMTIVGSGTGISIEVDSVDNVVGNNKVTLIKMDIEGAELEALRGSERVIRENHPKLAICVYHKPEDLITIPQYIKSLYPNYRLYLRHHQYMSWEMVLYAIPIS